MTAKTKLLTFSMKDWDKANIFYGSSIPVVKIIENKTIQNKKVRKIYNGINLEFNIFYRIQ